MPTKSIKFKLRQGTWRSQRPDQGAGLCAAGVHSYVGVPRDCTEFTAVFGTDKPVGHNHYALEEGAYNGVTLCTAYDPGLLSGASNLLRRMWNGGYRYLEVEYEVDVPVLPDHIVTFRQRERGGNWFSAMNNVPLCDDGLRDYVGVDAKTREFDARFTDVKPTGDAHFKLLPTGKLDTRINVGFYDEAQGLIRGLHNRGYRYLSVEF